MSLVVINRDEILEIPMQRRAFLNSVIQELGPGRTEEDRRESNRLVAELEPDGKTGRGQRILRERRIRFAKPAPAGYQKQGGHADFMTARPPRQQPPDTMRPEPRTALAVHQDIRERSPLRAEAPG